MPLPAYSRRRLSLVVCPHSYDPSMPHPRCMPGKNVPVTECLKLIPEMLLIVCTPHHTTPHHTTPYRTTGGGGGKARRGAALIISRYVSPAAPAQPSSQYNLFFCYYIPDSWKFEGSRRPGFRLQVLAVDCLLPVLFFFRVISTNIYII